MVKVSYNFQRMPKKQLPNTFPTQYQRVMIAFLGAHLIWGAATAVIKYTLDYIPPFTLLFLRFLIVCIFVLPILSHQLKKEPINKKDYLNLFLLGVFSQTALVIPFVALKFTTALDLAILGVMGAVLTVYAGHYYYRDKINGWVSWGLFLASAGTLLVVVEPLLLSHNNEVSMLERTLGNILAFFYALLWVVYVIWTKYTMGEGSEKIKRTLRFLHLRPMTRNYSATIITLSSFFVGLATLTPLAIIENMGIGSTQNFDILTIDIRGIAGLFYLAIFSSIIAYWLNQWALHKGKASDYAIFSYLAPIFTFPFAYILLGELPNSLMFVGGILIAIGVFLAEKGNHKPC